MDIIGLSYQYSQAGKILRKRLRGQKEKLKTLSGKEEKKLERVINDLYLMCLDCEKTARYLRHYYDGARRIGGENLENRIA